MASITTIIGLLPLIIFQDVLFYGMAVVIAFGLGIGTFIISLELTPVMYCLFFGLNYSHHDDNEAWASNIQAAPV